MKKDKLYVLLILILGNTLGSCVKDKLDIKPDKTQVVPTTLTDFQALLDNTVTVFGSNYIGAAQISSGEYALSYTDFQSLSFLPEINSYTWQKDIWQGTASVIEWDSNYKSVFYANVVLDGLSKVTVSASNQADYNNVKGQALFQRANAFYNVAQQFAKAYNSSTAATDFGIPLRLSSDLNEKSVRSTVEQTYRQIMVDLNEALSLLPVTSVSKYRPNKCSAYAEMARIYLAMGNYNQALNNADASLKLYGTLLDYNTLNPNPATAYPIPDLNNEVILRYAMSSYQSFSKTVGKIDQSLYQSYQSNDLRKTTFFYLNTDGSVGFRGSYRKSSVPFSGLATDEQYLIRAEGYARKGMTNEAMSDLNALLTARFKTGTFIPLTAVSSDNALLQILAERKKELIFRGLRWTDLKRLNQESRFAVILTRSLNGTVYTLPPNDARYVFPIPDYIISATGMQQNLR
ncbi:MAG: RagB/SusD family nutrient uptake outer membrane protein [Mucilaginibacter sp.]|uniref:RagB/SusD family nutrient uptake outer membrane protein n=1 Tax=Mucilaginibacter sp. TaxID=1882438 RepID=UPI0032651D36